MINGVAIDWAANVYSSMHAERHSAAVSAK